MAILGPVFGQAGGIEVVTEYDEPTDVAIQETYQAGIRRSRT